jgi:hypothetical protein
MALHLNEYMPAKILEMPFDIGTLSEHLLWHERHTADPAHVWLRKVFKSVAEAL